jgi:hypothetical protein
MTSTRADILVAAPVAERHTVTLAVEHRAVVALVEVPHTRLVAEPRVATQVEALSTVTSVVELRAVGILARVPHTVSPALVPHAAIRAAARRTVTSVVEPRVATLAVTPVAVLRT